MTNGPCTSEFHVGDREPLYALDAFEIRLERRRLWDLSDRKYRRIAKPVCRACAGRYLAEPETVPTVSLFEDTGGAG